MTIRIKNYLDTPKETLEGSHDGLGPFSLQEIWEKSDFNSNIDFFDRVIIPPNSTVGEHRHGNNEEIYIILSGTGCMTIDGEQRVIKTGDMILNKAGGTHSLVNNSADDIDILVLQVSL